VQELTVFVPHDATLKVARLRMRNTLTRHRRLTATYYAEWVLGSRRENQRQFIVSAFEREHACLLATCSWQAEFAGRVAFLAAEGQVHGFTADRSEFLGSRGDYAHPAALERWGLSERVDQGADPCAALQVHIDLAPGESMTTHFILGQAANKADALELVARYRHAGVVDAAFTALQAYWDNILGAIRVKTPEPAMDLMLNRWLLYQTLSARVFGRTGFYQSSGAFGYRDQLQDVLALLHVAPQLARAHILEAAAHQFEEGDVLHWWHPPSGRGVRTRCSDDLAWLPYVTCEYVTATGDAAILDVVVPFLSGAPLHPGEHDRYAEYAASTYAESLFEHCKRAIERSITAGVHGLPLMGDGDWNDGMNRVGAEGRGESVWLGWFLCAAMNRFAALADQKCDVQLADSWRARADGLRTQIKLVAWDGAYYLRAYHDDGSTLGSANNRECRIDSIAQSWSVLSERQGAPHDLRSRAAVGEADKQLVNEPERLVRLLWPPFDNSQHDPGYIRAYPPGIRENGGQYTHAATWLGFAHAALGDGEHAARIFRLLNPVLHASTPSDCARYRVEPYALAGDIYSCKPWTGRGGWTWYTGAAAWMWRLGIEAILGLRWEAGALHINPCIPPTWPKFEAWVRQGDRVLHIVVENPQRVAFGIATITMDGLALVSHTIGFAGTHKAEHEIRIVLGFPTLPVVKPSSFIVSSA
jgi:cyclic beta-1,2-glucan synthetase